MNPILAVLTEGAVPGLLIAGLLLAAMPWIDPRGKGRLVPVVLVIALTFYYLFWRVTVTIPPISQPVDWAFGWLFFLIEFGAVAGSLISYVTLTRTSDRSAEVERNKPWLAGLPRQPLVDVFICTYNEDREILHRTILGATGMTYANYRVWVLDDGKRPWLADLAAELGAHYLTRPDSAHAKAGNINHALKHVASLPEPPDFVSVLDADFVPTPMFLSRALTLFKDEDVGVVQTPQHFINPDPIQANLQTSDVWPDEQRYFFDVLMPAKDAWGTAFCCGTSSVIRMAALERAGGFPTESVTEDYLLTLRLKRNGFRTVYLNERLSLGLAPEGLNEYITQRSRWCLGFIQIIRGKDGPFKPGNGLQLIDRVSLVESLLYWSMAYMFRIAGVLVPILYLLFGINAVNVATADGIAHFLPYYLAQIAVMAWLSGRRILPIMTDVSQLLAAREILTAVAVGLLKPHGHKFKVTAKGGDRSKTVVQWRMIGWLGSLLVLTMLGVLISFGLSSTLQDSSVVALYWSWYNMVILIAAIGVCIERPRRRQHERLAGAETVVVSAGDIPEVHVTGDISVGGMRLLGASSAPVGTRISILFRETLLEGVVVRRSDSDFAVALDDTQQMRDAMLRHVYSGGFRSPIGEIRAAKVARKMLARLAA